MTTKESGTRSCGAGSSRGGERSTTLNTTWELPLKTIRNVLNSPTQRKTTFYKEGSGFMFVSENCEHIDIPFRASKHLARHFFLLI